VIAQKAAYLAVVFYVIYTTVVDVIYRIANP
jgi:hypothetical protein